MTEDLRLLLRAPNWIGDAVMSLPAVAALKRARPSASITVLAKRRVIPVFVNNPDIDYIMEYDDRGAHRGISGRVRLAAQIRKGAFKEAILLQNAFDAAALVFMAGVPARTGYARDMRSALLTRAIKLTGGIKRAHQIFYYLNIVSQGELPPEVPVPRLFVSKEEEAWAEGFLNERGLKGARLVGAAPGASYGPAKKWPPERFSKVLAHFSKRGFVPLAFGGPEDREACTEAVAGIKGAISLAGIVGLRQFIALAKRLSLMVTNDSGPMHLSYALGVPTVAIFGSTDSSLTGPVGDRATVVSTGIDCSPCFERECRHGHYRCLKDITAEEVVEKASELIREGA